VGTLPVPLAFHVIPYICLLIPAKTKIKAVLIGLGHVCQLFYEIVFYVFTFE